MLSRQLIRAVRDDDGPALAALIGGCYAEYPGCVLDPEGEDADLAAPATFFHSRGGALWVIDAPRPGLLLASGGMKPGDQPGEWEVKRLYVTKAARGRGIASMLMDHVEREARARSATRLIAWSDTRFHDAHRFYANRGYSRLDAVRTLDDPSRTVEYCFRISLLPHR